MCVVFLKQHPGPHPLVLLWEYCYQSISNMGRVEVSMFVVGCGGAVDVDGCGGCGCGGFGGFDAGIGIHVSTGVALPFS
jgi:hypothetical protein